MGAIQKATSQNEAAMRQEARQSLNTAISTFLDKEGLRRRFDDLLGRRTPQFMSSLISLINADTDLREAYYHNPMSVVQAALKAATYDLPIDPALGYAYIVPFKKYGIPNASFIMGYKGMQQLALRTGAYKTINVIDVRQGELKSYNRLTEEIELDFIDDDEEREKVAIQGFVGYYRLVNGTEKTIYMSLSQINAHEKKHRKGKHQGKGWRENYEAMCAKTVIRQLIGKWGLMSIDYQRADAKTIAIADAIANERFDDEDGTVIEGIEAPIEDNSGENQEPPDTVEPNVFSQEEMFNH